MSAEGRRGAGARGSRWEGAQDPACSWSRRLSPELGFVRKPSRSPPSLTSRPPLRVQWDLPAFGGVTLTRAISSVLAGRSHGSRRDKDARWLLCGWDVGIERSCDGPEPRCHPKSDRGGAHWRGDAQVGGKTR